MVFDSYWRAGESMLIAFCKDRHGLTAKEQVDMMLAFGVAENDIWFERPGRRMPGEKPAWENCQMGLREGDALVVEGLHALGSNKDEVAACLTGMELRKVALVVLGDGLDTRGGAGFPFAAYAKAMARMETHFRRAGRRGEKIREYNAKVRRGEVKAKGRPKAVIPPAAVEAWNDVEKYPTAKAVADAFCVATTTMRRVLGQRPKRSM
jgi:DNA invertase Pin-like site-specific DNA recombinase